jgi:hypothetical protein
LELAETHMAKLFLTLKISKVILLIQDLALMYL